MRWDYGKVYQEIRKSKGLTQEDVCQNFLARSTLARIESGQTVPKFDTMIFLLHQIDMSLEEFKYICNLYHPSVREEIISKVYSYNTAIGTSELERLQNKCQNYLRTNHDIPIKRINDGLTSMILLRKNGIQKKSKELNHINQRIWHYLEKQDAWYENDFRLLNTILPHFPIEIVQNITSKILENLIKYDDYRNIDNSSFSLLSNLATIFLYNNLKEDCEIITLKTIDVAKKVKRYDYLGFSQVRLGICRKDDDLIKKGLELLSLTEETALLETMEEEIKNFR
jgi:transcriptional regulator with XRE-family HTH domain